MKRLQLSFGVLSLLLLIPALCFGQPRQGGERPAFGEGRQAGRQFDQSKGMRERLLKSLNLNGEQEKALEEFRKQRGDMREKALDLKDLRDELSLMLKKPDSTDKEILAKLRELTKLMTEVSESRVKNLLALKRKLDASQFKKIMRFGEAMRDQMKNRMRGGGSQQGFGGGPRQGFGGGNPGSQGGMPSGRSEDNGPDLPDL